MLPPFLQSLVNNESVHSARYVHYSPDAIVTLLSLLHNPHTAIKTIHIAGTNGKGSTAYMIAAMLQAAGYRVGLYTSPHLLRYNERITVNGNEIADETIAHFSTIIEQLCTKHNLHITFFDAFTAMAFLYFQNSVDIAVIETGLGGRLDSTNVVTPLVSVITPIAYDHTAILGNTLQQIAYQKAGIIKQNTPVVIAHQHPEALATLRHEAALNNAPIILFNTNIHCSITSNHPVLTCDVVCNHPLFGGLQKCSNVTIPLAGSFQAYNAAVAIAAVLLLKNYYWAIVTDDIIKALSTITIPGRSQLFGEDPLILFDCAHNPEAMQTTVEALINTYSGYDCIFCVSFMNDKDIHSLLTIIQRYTQHPVYYLPLNDSRSYYPDDEVIKNYHLIITDDIHLPVTIAKKSPGKTMVLFTGTFRLYPLVQTIHNA
ncbi:MAG TPA: Mur ligase family protein [Spirochaetota bacterium]|nr:Mur ligase family protein [Spirochaetota bacterium]HOR94479.1 Mur ligase family protein [Spirochaetota bacterium]HOT18386.1 Mur ligase family protein [Spirochaetota bacterium]HPD03733.1 Mur ligase family protein [Spirochaetota bacterium]HPK44638.1 Mur ligase family protein [Spirochaetota bacterium]